MDHNESAVWANTTLIPQSKKKRQNSESLASIDFRGAPDRTRTYNPQLRRLMLYPVELRAPLMIFKWSGQRDLNPRPSAPKADALPGCAMPRLNFKEVNRIILIKI